MIDAELSHRKHMTAKQQPRFDIDALKDVAGQTTFARGQSYHRDGNVQILAIEPARVLAQVAGSENYRTVVTGRGTDIDGECSCPAFEDRGFCKHMVAVALAANAVGNGAGASGAGALSRIRDHLRKRSVDALVEMIVDLAERDLGLFRKLDIAASLDHSDDKTLETRLRKAIDKATHGASYVDYWAVPAWAANVDATLDSIDDLVSSGRVKVAFSIVEHAMDRIQRAVETIDDSDGHCGALLHRAREIHLAAACATMPEPLKLARELFAREMKDDYEIFDGAAMLYAEVLGEQGLAEYRRLALEAWQQPAGASAGAGDDDEEPDNPAALMRILDLFAERDGDVESRIALRARDLSSSWKYLQLAEFCLTQGREDEALRRAEEGLWMFEDGRPNEHLVLFLAKLLSKAGRKRDAETQLWKAFEKAPSLELYAALAKSGDAAASGRAVKSLRAKLAAENRTGPSGHAELLIDILIEQGKFAEAWTIVAEHRVALETREDLAEASEATHLHEALQVYAERVEQLAIPGSNQGYAVAARLIARMAGLRSDAEQSAYMTALKARHGRKRNFMKLLG
ncbi:MAG TPA: SWIM zinc finger family protein [Bradyrhizobium sp.]